MSTPAHPKSLSTDNWTWSLLALGVIAGFVAFINITNESVPTTPTAIYCVSDTEHVWVEPVNCRPVSTDKPWYLWRTSQESFDRTTQPKKGFMWLFVDATSPQPAALGDTVTGAQTGPRAGPDVSYNGNCAWKQHLTSGSDTQSLIMCPSPDVHNS